jgi:hypothetical protein
MRTGVMEDAQGSYNHEEEIIGLHVDMGSVETESNGRRDRKDHVTMRSLQRKVQGRCCKVVKGLNKRKGILVFKCYKD